MCEHNLFGRLCSRNPMPGSANEAISFELMLAVSMTKQLWVMHLAQIMTLLGYWIWNVHSAAVRNDHGIFLFYADVSTQGIYCMYSYLHRSDRQVYEQKKHQFNCRYIARGRWFKYSGNMRHNECQLLLTAAWHRTNGTVNLNYGATHSHHATMVTWIDSLNCAK